MRGLFFVSELVLRMTHLALLEHLAVCVFTERHMFAESDERL